MATSGSQFRQNYKSNAQLYKSSITAAEKVELENTHKELKIKHEDLTKQLNQLNTKHTKLTDEHNKLNSLKDSDCKDYCQSKIEKTKKLEGEIKTHLKKIKSLEENIKTLHTNLEKLNKKCTNSDNHNEECANLINSNKELKIKLENLQKSLNKLEKTHNELSQENKKLLTNNTLYKDLFNNYHPDISNCYQSKKQKNKDFDETALSNCIKIKKGEKTEEKGSKKSSYDKLKSTIDNIKSKHIFTDNNSYKVDKNKATSITHQPTNTKCHEINKGELKSILDDQCNKIHHLHKLMDSLGMDKNKKGEVDEEHKEFLNFMSTGNLEEKHKSSFDKLSRDYAYTCKKGKIVPFEKATAIYYKDKNNKNNKECFKVKDKKITTYGENSFSDECAPLVNTYKMMHKEDVLHYNGCDLSGYNDSEFHELLNLNDAINNLDA